MSQPAHSLPRKRQDAIEALMRHATNEEAAKAAGVTARTLYRWLAEDRNFKAALNAKRAETFEHAKNVVQKVMTEAAAKLRRMVCEEEVASASSVMACRTMLQFGLRFREVDVDDRLAELNRIAVKLTEERAAQQAAQRAEQ